MKKTLLGWAALLLLLWGAPAGSVMIVTDDGQLLRLPGGGGGGGGVSVVMTDTSGQGVDTSSITEPITTVTTTNGGLYVLITHNRANTTFVTGVTHNGNAMTQVPGATATNADVPTNCQAYYLHLGSHTGATANVVASASDTLYWRLDILQVEGESATPVHDGTGLSQEDTAFSITVGNVSTGHLVVDWVSSQEPGTTLTVGANQTQIGQRQDVNISDNAASSYQSGANGGVMSWTPTAERRAAQCGFAITPS
jgi:hypothetical protein